MSLLSDNNKKELQIYDLLKNVIDPEVGINIIDFGLIYKINYSKEGGIHIEMTLSSKACPMGTVIVSDVESTLRSAFPATDVDVKLVWYPSWTPEFITPSGKKALNHR
jgi:metal-sulfur cluster biosynthetic enzyme